MADAQRTMGLDRLEPEQVQRLERFDGDGARVLSAYLDLDPARQVQRSYRVAFEDCLKEARKSLGEEQRESLAQEAERLRVWLEGESPRGKGLALFSCQTRGLWEAHFLPVTVKDHVAFEPKPDVAPLLELIDDYERYAVALVDKERARLFTVFAGAIEEGDAFEDFVPRKHQQGGYSQANFQRHHETHVLWHLKRVAQRLEELVRRRSFDRLIIAGPAEATSELSGLLSHDLSGRLVGVIPAELFAPEKEILEKTLEIESRVEREGEERVLAELLEEAGSGGRAIHGLAATLEALWMGEVQKLVLADGNHAGGSECPGCARLEPGASPTCPACGQAMIGLHDLFHRAAGRALDQGGCVEVVHGEVAGRLGRVGEGMAARLRYRPGAAPNPGDGGPPGS